MDSLFTGQHILSSSPSVAVFRIPFISKQGSPASPIKIVITPFCVSPRHLTAAIILHHLQPQCQIAHVQKSSCETLHKGYHRSICQIQNRETDRSNLAEVPYCSALRCQHINSCSFFSTRSGIEGKKCGTLVNTLLFILLCCLSFGNKQW